MKKIKIGDLITLKGMSKHSEKPIGMVKRKWATGHLEIIWLNENIAKRFAINNVVDPKKIEVISEASQQSPSI